ncbi:pantoate--beta-alanine ligase, partial [Streptomyces tricolor]
APPPPTYPQCAHPTRGEPGPACPARVGTTRLIDNLPLTFGAAS